LTLRQFSLSFAFIKNPHSDADEQEAINNNNPTTKYFIISPKKGLTFELRLVIIYL
jgi:hypothetical protein